MADNIPSPMKLEPPGQREVVEAAKAEEMIGLWKEQLVAQRKKVEAAVGPDGDVDSVVLCDRIRLSDKSYTAEAASIIAAFLNEPFEGGAPIAQGIVEADLTDMIAGRMTEEGLQVLRTICDSFASSKLVDVDLGENAIGQQGIGACKSVLSKPSLERLSLCNNGLSQATMAQVADILTSDADGNGPIAARLTKIHFYNNMSGEGGCNEFARILEHSSNLVDVRFSSTRAGRKGSAIVASALDVSLADRRNVNLKKLDFCDNNFGDDATHLTLFRALGATQCLSYLNLRDCELEDHGVKKVCHALFESDSALEHLDLSGNDITRRGAKHIADYIRDCGGKLKVLRLEDNEMKSKGIEAIAAAIHGSDDGAAIEEIQLNTNMCGDIGARALIDAFGPEGRDLPHLKKVQLNGNSFSEDVMVELEAAFKDFLEEMDDNDPDDDADEDQSDDDEDDDDFDDDNSDAAVAIGGVDDLTEMIHRTSIV